ncbi:MAG: bifunctional DNA-formamidopyrimidine glycosylase/DNA-(apurinic or apyrimidinic site) lyase [Asticcacaulis sp.]|uniref:bifunctional DNA-formamidopyrimidine glycosylase/DNA-(apurinic or apyrimidinic site) lyase n=1 Tax=Asticcacaulis sp. TaxID=1872648 RepID=UPI0025B80560|nr:bifunctional DNA-formamidopyrimidine glycosylase/DNA-(apurinic or apyrimidinic site) lyase [Asticcacaulis sp.]MCA1936614.1 bifunctional DNA-formamidopyrimidine glycosylase/DNA-(apurinic or apyrimidinic site) lyase [Asticcacaulis sp.]
MPELPEVETVRRGLTPALEHARLSGLRLHRSNLRYAFPERFAEQLEGAEILRLERRAKYLLFHLDTQAVWVTHLGMTGRFQVTDIDGQSLERNDFYRNHSAQAAIEAAAKVAQATARRGAKQKLDGNYYHAVRPDPKHLHVQVLATKGGVTRLIDFYDPRRFGFMLLLRPDELYAQGWYKGLGLEPLSDALNADALHALFSPRRTPLKSLLMDQTLISGLGNIYVCEALWRAALSPDLPSDRLSHTKAAELTLAVREVLEEAVAAGGSSISDFASASGELGYFQHRFRVYDREDEPCLRPGCGGTIARKTHSGRSTFYCPACQKG